MSTTEDVIRQLKALAVPKEPLPTHDPLAEAERLADLYSSVKVVPYRVPVERFIGLSYFANERHEDGDID